MNLEQIFISTNHQKILNFLSLNAGEEFFEGQVVKITKLSSGSVNQVLKNLQKLKLILVRGKGRQKVFSVDLDNPVIKSWKTLHNIISIKPLIDKISPKAERIILFGSQGQGTNLANADIDLFVLSNTPNDVHSLVNNNPLAEQIQLITKKSVDLIKFKKRHTLFWEQIERGIVVYQKQ